MDEISISQNGITVILNMNEIKESLTSEQRMTLAKDLCWDEVMKEAKMRLAGQSDCWSGSDKEMTFQFLKEQMIDRALSIKFGVFDRVRQKITDHVFDSRLYYALTHCKEQMANGDHVSLWFNEWRKRNGFADSNHWDKTSEAIAGDIIQKFEAMLREEVAVCD